MISQNSLLIQRGCDELVELLSVDSTQIHSHWLYLLAQSLKFIILNFRLVIEYYEALQVFTSLVPISLNLIVLRFQRAQVDICIIPLADILMVARVWLILDGSHNHQSWDAHEDLSLTGLNLLFELNEGLTETLDV